MKQYLYKYAGLFLIVALFGSCMKEPVYPKEPHIEFNSIRVENKRFPRIHITLDFRDGDGNLGLNKPDLARKPFSDTLVIENGDTVVNRTKASNYFIKPYYKQKGKYVPYPNIVLKDGYRFPRLEPMEKQQALEGQLSYFFDIFIPIYFDFPDYKPGDSLKFEIFIVDRELNKSNIIETTPVAIYQD